MSALLVPVLGYFLLYNARIEEWLALKGFAGLVGWRLHFLYFGGCAFAAGSVVYALWCPAMVKKYRDSTDYNAGEGEVLDLHADGRLKDLIFLVTGDERDKLIEDVLTENEIALGHLDRADYTPEQQIHHERRKSLMLVLNAYHAMDYKYPAARIAAAICYVLGISLIAAPTLTTMGQVFWHVVTR